MFKQEFESLAGYRVTDSDYFGIIEPMYMATNLNKADFVACLDRKRFALPTEAEAIKTLKKMAKEYAEETETTDKLAKFWQLEDKAHTFAEEFHHINVTFKNDWCHINTKESRTSGRVLSVVWKFGRLGSVSHSVTLYERPNVSAYEALTF